MRIFEFKLLALAAIFRQTQPTDVSSSERKIKTEDDFWVFPSCDIPCANGGYCNLVDGTADELVHMAQSGRLVSTCHCKPGFTGIACENIHQECYLPERKCSNGMPCRAINNDDESTEWVCDCALADSLSKFAGKMCRDPITEYCSGKFDPHAPLVFCTNGGRCRSDVIGAQVDPRNTTVNKDYQHAGCICPPDFYGPHCEFLKLNVVDDIDESFEFKDQQDDNSNTTTKPRARNSSLTFGLAVLFALLSLSLVAIAIKLHTKQPKTTPVDEVRFGISRDNVSVISMSTANQRTHYLDNVDFLDEGIIVPQRLDTIYENPEIL
jgi:hypothetical protein